MAQPTWLNDIPTDAVSIMLSSGLVDVTVDDYGAVIYICKSLKKKAWAQQLDAWTPLLIK